MTRPGSWVLLAGTLLAAAAAAEPPDPLERAHSLYQEGRLSEAVAAYRAAAAAGEDPETVAIGHNNACFLLIRMAEHEAALDECRAALRLRREIGDDRGVARTLNNLGLAFRHLGRYDEAAIAYREALAVNERRGDAEAQLFNLSNLGVLAAASGQYGDAMRFHVAAEELAAANAGEPWAAKQSRIARLNQTTVLEKLGAYREALELARALAAETGGDDPELAAQVQANLGVIYRNLGDPIQAIAAFESAAEVYAELGYNAALSNAKLNLALALHLNLGRLAEAEDAYLAALELARRGGDRAEEIQDLFYLGHLQLERGRLDAAAGSFGACLDLARDSGTPEGRWSGLYGLGRVAEARGDLGGALGLFRQATDEVEQVRARLADASWRSGFFGDKRPVYAAAVRVLAALDAAEPDAGHGLEALAMVQRAKARELLEALGTERHAAAPLAGDALRRVPRAGETVLEYFQGDADLFLWVLRDGGVEMANLGPVGPVFARVREIRSALAAGRVPPRELVGELSRILLEPAAPLADGTRLRVAPDGHLHYLPFEILAAGPPGEPLVDRLTVSYLPSLSTLDLIRGRRDAGRRDGGSPPLRLAGFANPELPADPEEPRAPASLVVARYGLAPLPAAERELAAASRILGGDQDLRTGPEATEEAFRRAAARGSRVLHLAAHTVLDERSGQGGVIVLAAGDGDDGLVYPAEISGLDYRAELTVLASCRSALGGLEDGRALASLSGSLLAAGSSAVVATLWDVDDAAAAAFMEQLYHQLRRGRPPDEALRRAKLRLRADPDWNRPDLWAAYVLIGDGSVPVARPPVPLWTAVAVIALLLAALLWRRRRAAIGSRSTSP